MTMQTAEVDGTGDLATFGATTEVSEPEEEAPTTPVSEEAPAEQGEQAEDGDQKEEPDYKSLYEAEQAETAKLKQRESSIRGNTRKQAERDRAQDVMGDEIAGMKEVVAALAKGIASNDMSEVPGELEQVEQRTNQAVQTRRVSGFKDALLQQILDSATGADGKLLFNVETEPGLQATRELWSEAVQGVGDVEKMTLATMQAVQYGRSVERKNFKEIGDRRYAEGRKKGLDEAGVDDMAAPEGSGSGGEMAEVAARDAFVAGDVLTPTQEKDYAAYKVRHGLDKLNR